MEDEDNRDADSDVSNEIDRIFWTKEKLMASLKRIVHKDVFTKISNIDIVQFATTEIFDNDVVEHYLEYIFKKPELRLQMYSETAQGLLNDLVGLQRVPLIYKYLNLPRKIYYKSEHIMIAEDIEEVKDDCYCSNIDIMLILYKHLRRIMGEEAAEKYCEKYFEKYEGFYELIPGKRVEAVSKLFENFDTMEHIDKVVDSYRELSNPTEIEGKKQVPTSSLLEMLLKIHQERIEVERLPVLRLFHDEIGDFCFAKEAETAVIAAFKIRYPDKKLPNVLIRHDNTEDRKLGILHILEQYELEALLKFLELTEDDLRVTRVPDNKLQREYLSLPVVSPYGTHCKLAFYTYFDIIDNLFMDMRLFQRMKRSNMPRIIKYFENLQNIFDSNRNYLYAIETWKLDEIIAKAHKELKTLLVTPIYNIPLKSSFNKRELLEEMNKFSPNLNIELHLMQHLNSKYSSLSEYSYFIVFQLLFVGTKSKLDKYLCQKFCIIQGSRDESDLFGDAIQLCENYQRAKFESKLPPGLRFGKNDLGEVQAPKSKKNIKPDFSKKINKEKVLIETLKCLNENFERFQKFEIEKLKEYFGQEEWEFLKEVFESKEKRKEIEDVFDIEVNGETYVLKRKSAEFWTGKAIEEVEAKKELVGKVEKLENEQKMKNVELERLNNKIADTVQKSIEKIRKSKEESGKENEQLRNELETANKNLEEAIKNTTTQKSVIKQKYREEVNKLNRICEEKENKIQKLHEELRECREELRNEREERNNQNDRDLKMANESIRRKDVELEALKLWKTSKTVEISELTEKNRQLETKLEVAEMGSSSGEELQEHQQEHGLTEELLSENEKLTSELQKLTKKYEDLERRMFSGLRGSPKIEERLKKYEKIMNIDYEAMIDGLSSNLHRLAKLYPDSSEIQKAKLEVRNFDENFEEYIGNVKKEYERMKEYPNDELGAEIQEFPSQEFWEKYRKWVEDNGLEL